MSKARDIANILSASTNIATDAEVATSVSSAVSTHATAANGHIGRGTTENRPASPSIGDTYFDTTLAALISYKSGGWEKVSQDPAPQIASISPTTAVTTGTTITITGSNFKSGLTVQFIGANATSYNSPVASFVNGTTLTATTPTLSVANEPYDVKVINNDNQFAILENALDAGGTPTWNTVSGTIATINEQTALNVSVSATDPDGTSIVYSSSNLPAWISLNSSTGALTGTSPDVSVDTTYNFDITASDGVNTSSRSFSLTVKTYIVFEVEYLVIAGGGSGGTADDGGGGGGAGGYRSSVPGEQSGRLSSAESPLFITSPQTLSVVVGNGGNGVRGNGYNDNGGLGDGKGNNGQNSQFGSIISIGGGGGGGIAGDRLGRQAGSNGGSGGGGGQRDTAPGGLGTNGQGFNGGNVSSGTGDAGGGGGGAGSAGNNSNGNLGGSGGNGISSSITGSSVTRAGGGGAGGADGQGSPGSGGGGFNQGVGLGGTNGSTNTGSGGGGGNAHIEFSGAGGKGIVIVRYSNIKPDISSISAGLTYTRSDITGYKVYQFTSGSGTVTF